MTVKLVALIHPPDKWNSNSVAFDSQADAHSAEVGVGCNPDIGFQLDPQQSWSRPFSQCFEEPKLTQTNMWGKIAILIKEPEPHAESSTNLLFIPTYSQKALETS